MGEAFISVANDANAIHYNPAGLSNFEDIEFSATHLKGFMDINYESICYVHPIKKIGTLGASIIVLLGGDMEVWEYTLLDVKKAEQDFMFTLSYGKELGSLIKACKGLSLGLNFKMIYSILLEEYDAFAYTFDFGMLYKLLDDKLSIGLCVQNLGGELRYEEAGDPLPLTIGFGGSYKLILFENCDILAAFDIRYFEDKWREHIGLEYSVIEMVYLRAGCKFGYDISAVTAGLGYNSGLYQLDYSFGLMRDLEHNHRVSLTIRFQEELLNFLFLKGPKPAPEEE